MKNWKISFVQVSERHTDNSTKSICSLIPCMTLSGAEVGLPQSSACRKKHFFPLYLWKQNQIRSIIDSMAQPVCSHKCIFCCQICPQRKLHNKRRPFLPVWLHPQTSRSCYSVILGNIFWYLPACFKTSPSCNMLIIFPSTLHHVKGTPEM